MLKLSHTESLGGKNKIIFYFKKDQEKTHFSKPQIQEVQKILKGTLKYMEKDLNPKLTDAILIYLNLLQYDVESSPYC